jgi:hypothetical protein
MNSYKYFIQGARQDFLSENQDRLYPCVERMCLRLEVGPALAWAEYLFLTTIVSCINCVHAILLTKSTS